MSPSPSLLDLLILTPSVSFNSRVDHNRLILLFIMPVDSPETGRVGALEDITQDRRRSSVTRKGMVISEIVENNFGAGERPPTEDELHGPNKLRRVAAPIPWSVYTVAFVELCERFSYYGTQVVCT